MPQQNVNLTYHSQHSNKNRGMVVVILEG